MEQCQVLWGDALAVLRTLEAESVDCCVTSPPYWSLRDYQVAGQCGLEPTPDAYVAHLGAVFAEVRRVLRPEATLWLVLGDTHARDARKGQHKPGDTGKSATVYDRGGGRASATADLTACGLKEKDLVGIPWRVAFALQADGYYLRSDIVWHKPNAFPESVTDRPTRSHEYVFLFSKSARYYYNGAAIREPATMKPQQRFTDGRGPKSAGYAAHRQPTGMTSAEFRNKRSVWTVSTKPFHGSHYAVFPPALIEPCILAGCPPGGVVLDPFGGTGTTAEVALTHGRRAILIDLDERNAAHVQARLAKVQVRLEG